MALDHVTVEYILDPLTDSEKQEAMRDDFSIPLKIFLKGFNENVSAKYQQSMIPRLRHFIRNRAAVRNEISKNPDILQTPMDSPLIIIGLPRSGTTVLQRLLSNDKQFLTPMAWELSVATPPGRPENWMESKRFKTFQQSIPKDQQLGGGDLDRVHLMRAELSAECLLLFMHYFLDSVMPLAFEGHQEWRDFVYNCPDQHLSSAYDFHEKCLKCIFYGNLGEGKSLLLKSNIHLLYLEKLREMYPNAKFIFPVRDIREVVGSYCSLKAQILGMVGSDEDPKTAARRGLEYIKLCTSRVVKAFKSWSQDCYVTLSYTELVANPLEEVKKMYSHFNLNLTPETGEAMQRYLQENPQNKHGKHEYSLEEFGLSEEEVVDQMADFVEYFNQKI